jgi:hypothetical protein
LLQDAFDRKHMHVKCIALVNDVCAIILDQLVSVPHLPEYFRQWVVSSLGPTSAAAAFWVLSSERVQMVHMWNKCLTSRNSGILPLLREGG